MRTTLVTDGSDRSAHDALRRIDAEAAAEHGWNPLGESVWRDLADPAPDSRIVVVREGDDPVAAVHACRTRRGWTLAVAARDDVVPPTATACAAVAELGGGTITAWVTDSGSPGSLAARASLRSVGLAPTRRLRRLEVALPVRVAPFPPGIEVGPFTDADVEGWLNVNNRAFPDHSEQGDWDTERFARRRAEAWFDPADLRCAREASRLVGSCWTKAVHELDRPPIGEIYVIAVDPDHHRRGLGAALVTEGLDHQRRTHGAEIGMLYTESDNSAALALYGSLGFEAVRTDEAWTGTVG
ncbi:MAG: mycothiol synthase [Actinomycetes bacterium]